MIDLVGFLRTLGAGVAVFIAAAFPSCAMMGCKDELQHQNTLEFLQQGKARGHLVITTTGALSAGMRTVFFAGADETAVSFDGDVDFADSVRHLGGALLPDGGGATDDPPPAPATSDDVPPMSGAGGDPSPGMASPASTPDGVGGENP